MQYEYIGNMPPDEQERLIEFVAGRYGHGNEEQKRQQAIAMVVPVLEEGTFDNFVQALNVVLATRSNNLKQQRARLPIKEREGRGGRGRW